MSDFLDQAERALEDADFWGSAAFVPNLKTLLRQAIKEVRARDERLSGQDFAIDELKLALKEENAACKRLEAENANLKLRIEAENEADNEMHAIHKARIEALEGQVQVADMLANKLKAENAKLREAARHALELAKIIERGDRVEGKNHASSEIVNTLRAALGSDGPGDAS